MKKVILSIAVLILSLFNLSAQTVEEIVAQNLNAIGGVAKLSEVKSVITENSIKMQALEIENTTTVMVGKAVRIESKIMGNDIIQAFDGTMAWEKTPIMMGGSGEAKLMPEEMLKSIINQIDPFPLLDYAKKGTQLTLLAAEKVKDKEAHHLKIVPKIGAESEIWIDVASGLMSKLKTIQNGQEVEIIFLNYTEIEGINFATSMETSNPMAGAITIDTKSVKLNTAIDELFFELIQTQKVASKLTPLYRQRVIECLFHTTAIVLLIGFIFMNITQFPYAASAIGLLVFYLTTLVNAIKQINLIRSMDFNKDLATMQSSLVMLQTHIVNYVKLTILFIPTFLAYPVVLTKVIKDFDIKFLAEFDIIEKSNGSWWTLEWAMFVILVPLGIWFYKEVSYKNMDKKWVKDFIQKSSGTRVTKALEFLKELQGLKQDNL